MDGKKTKTKSTGKTNTKTKTKSQNQKKQDRINSRVLKDASGLGGLLTLGAQLPKNPTGKHKQLLSPFASFYVHNEVVYLVQTR